MSLLNTAVDVIDSAPPATTGSQPARSRSSTLSLNVFGTITHRLDPSRPRKSTKGSCPEGRASYRIQPDSLAAKQFPARGHRMPGTGTPTRWVSPTANRSEGAIHSNEGKQCTESVFAVVFASEVGTELDAHRTGRPAHPGPLVRQLVKHSPETARTGNRGCNETRQRKGPVSGGYAAHGPCKCVRRADRIRTCDPLTPSQVRYQTAPQPGPALLSAYEYSSVPPERPCDQGALPA